MIQHSLFWINPLATRMFASSLVDLTLLARSNDIFIIRKLYPQDVDVPADSDYDNQQDVEPVGTDLMPLEKQDPKLQADYINLPELLYVVFIKSNL
jgi:hypothetical protein